MNNDIMTIDIEGDGISGQLRDLLFPDFGHFDKDTLPWCISMRDANGMVTYVCKLPSEGRKLDMGIRSAKHKEGTVVPKEINGYTITEFDDRDEMIIAVMQKILERSKNCKPTYFKSYWDSRFRTTFQYDKVLLRTYMEGVIERRYQESEHDAYRRLVERTLLYLIPVGFRKGIWEKTPEQGNNPTGDKDIFISQGIMHNIGDTEQLYRLILEGKHFLA